MLPLRMAAALAALALLTACSGESDPEPAPATPGSPAATGTASQSAEPGPTGAVALLLRDGDIDRGGGFDRSEFETRLGSVCPGCSVSAEDAEGDVETQTTQLATLVGTPTDVVVLDPVNPLAVTTLVQQLRDYGTKVVVVGPPVVGADFRIAFDDDAVGTAQARALLRAAGPGPQQVMMVNGSPADPDALTVKAAAHRVLDESRAVLIGEYDDPGTAPRQLRRWLNTLLAVHPPATVGGVYAANDRIAGEVIATFEAAGADPAALPPVTGAGAGIGALRRLVAGTQLMTVYRPPAPASRRAAEVATALLTGTDPGSSIDVGGTATALLRPVPIGAEDIADTVVADGYRSVDRICTEDLTRACRRLGLTGRASGR